MTGSDYFSNDKTVFIGESVIAPLRAISIKSIFSRIAKIK